MNHGTMFGVLTLINALIAEIRYFCVREKVFTYRQSVDSPVPLLADDQYQHIYTGLDVSGRCEA